MDFPTIGDLRLQLSRAGYTAERDLATALFLALRLEKPWKGSRGWGRRKWPS